MSDKFVRIVSGAEWSVIERTRSISPSDREDCPPYRAGEVVFLHRDTVSISYVISYLQDYCDDNPGHYHLLRVAVPLTRPSRIEEDQSADYDMAVVHRGSIRESDGCVIQRVATFDCRDLTAIL